MYGRVKSTDVRSGRGASRGWRWSKIFDNWSWRYILGLSMAQNLSQRLNHVVDGADSYMAHSIRSIGDVGPLSASNEIVETQTNWLCSQCGKSRLGRLAIQSKTLIQHLQNLTGCGTDSLKHMRVCGRATALATFRVQPNSDRHRLINSLSRENGAPTPTRNAAGKQPL